MRNTKLGVVLVGIVLGSALTARAGFDLTFTWSGTYYESGFSGDSPNYIIPADAIGIYKFTTDGNGISNPFYSVCLDPAGLLDGAKHTYTAVSFSEANPGAHPNGWAWGVVNNTPQYWGINNAAWLWSKYGMGIVNNTGNIGEQNQRAAALEFAIWTVLYNSDGYGHLASSPAWTPPSLTGSTATWYQTYVDALKNSGITGPQYTGNILQGENYTVANSGSAQEFFMLGTPIPEPTTLLAGALLLIPFGIASLRIARKA